MVAAIEQMYGRRALSDQSNDVHAIRNNAFDRPILARCGVRVGDTVGQDQAVTCELCAAMLSADRRLLNLPFAERIAATERAIREAGFTLRYVDACEGDGAAGLIGMGLGVAMWDRREVRIRTMLSGQALLDVLEHELLHVLELPGFERGTHSFGGTK